MRGGHDYQTTPEDLENWRMEVNTNDGVFIRKYDGLNHMFMPVDKESCPSEYHVPGNVSSVVLKDVAEFVTEAG